jgi:tetratricopeptide (TPR) repeat protein
MHLCRNSNDAADKIAHCSNVIAQSSNVSALVTAHNTRGLALMDAGRVGEAVDDFTFVIRHEPQIAGFYDNRQNAYRRSGRLDDALKDANEAIRLARTYSFVFRGRANVYNDMGNYDLAALDYDQAIRLAPNDGGLFIDRGKILRTQSGRRRLGDLRPATAGRPGGGACRNGSGEPSTISQVKQCSFGEHAGCAAAVRTA